MNCPMHENQWPVTSSGKSARVITAQAQWTVRSVHLHCAARQIRADTHTHTHTAECTETTRLYRTLPNKNTTRTERDEISWGNQTKDFIAVTAVSVAVLHGSLCRARLLYVQNSVLETPHYIGGPHGATMNKAWGGTQGKLLASAKEMQPLLFSLT